MTAVPTCEINGHSGDVIVFLHGIGGNAAYWQPLSSFLGQWFQAMAWNMPGYGTSTALTEMTFHALATALDHLLDAYKVEQFHLVGHSMGGMVAQEFMVYQENRVRSLTLFATSPSFGKPDRVWQQNFIRQRLKLLDEGGNIEEIASQIVPELLGVNTDSAVREMATTSIVQCPPEVYRTAVRCLVTFERRAELSHLQTPTLLVTGDQDTLAPPSLMEK
jgi:pimeloyl-ACP methyl ester carboxylesterase